MSQANTPEQRRGRLYSGRERESQATTSSLLARMCALSLPTQSMESALGVVN
jgi:hypothetical protein